jgi:hypothetical protein
VCTKKLKAQVGITVLLLETYVQLPLELQPFIPVQSHALPDHQQVQALAKLSAGLATQFCNQHPWLGKDDSEAQQRLIAACQGLPVGEIEIVLSRLLTFANTLSN